MNIFFLQRPLHRKRQRETVEHCPAVVRALTPEISFTKDTEILHRYRSVVGWIKGKIARWAVVLNVRRVRDLKARQADLLYTWGVIPLGRGKRYVIELDNPYVLTFYNLTWFRILRPFLRRTLLNKRCQGIVCISQAAKHTLRRELGAGVADKAHVVYPFISPHTKNRAKTAEGVEFLFVSTQFYLKGGRETLRAFERLASAYPEVHLTLVSNTPREVVAAYAKTEWVSFVEASLDKERLFQEYFSQADVFVLPTYQDSFGLVFLEAVSFGLPVITTRLYAIPEMVEDGRNGILIEPPFFYYGRDGLPVPEYWNTDLSARIQEETYPRVERELLDAMKRLMSDRVRSMMAEESLEIFRGRFSKTVRDEAFLGAVTGGQRDSRGTGAPCAV